MNQYEETYRKLNRIGRYLDRIDSYSSPRAAEDVIAHNRTLIDLAQRIVRLEARMADRETF